MDTVPEDRLDDLPARTRSSDDLPAPLGPMIAVTPPARATPSNALKICAEPHRSETSRHETSGPLETRVAGACALAVEPPIDALSRIAADATATTSRASETPSICLVWGLLRAWASKVAARYSRVGSSSSSSCPEDDDDDDDDEGIL